MWYEILPTMGIIAVCYVVPQLVPYYVEKLVYGNPRRRDFTLDWTAVMTDRDELLTGDYRKPKGLEAIPDN
ncbi:NADH dehydrogenase [ubiquinone] 1 alpha subcomplex subunit 1-like [Osmia lignaria lignaria]|uniref:NADH dehydrogenase [ubiquinone] 1 alpha subcomplex subunit 1-like n=1 Tax=Osmia lignaria lignaria TaxID=1437193 RepID=UPI00402B30D3